MVFGFLLLLSLSQLQSYDKPQPDLNTKYPSRNITHEISPERHCEVPVKWRVTREQVPVYQVFFRENTVHLETARDVDDDVDIDVFSLNQMTKARNWFNLLPGFR